MIIAEVASSAGGHLNKHIYANFIYIYLSIYLSIYIYIYIYICIYISPDPGQQFNEGAKSFGVSLEAAYQQTYSASLSFRAFSGGDYNILSDKDFIALSLGITY